jgi:hypothetical protein
MRAVQAVANVAMRLKRGIVAQLSCLIDPRRARCSADQSIGKIRRVLPVSIFSILYNVHLFLLSEGILSIIAWHYYIL